MIQKGGKRLGPTCGAGTAQEKKAGVGLLLNGAYVIIEQDPGFGTVRTYVHTLASHGVMHAGVTWRHVVLLRWRRHLASRWPEV